MAGRKHKMDENDKVRVEKESAGFIREMANLTTIGKLSYKLWRPSWRLSDFYLHQGYLLPSRS